MHVHWVLSGGRYTVWSQVRQVQVGRPRAAQRKLLLEANRRPPSLVDVSRAVTAGQGGVAVTAGRRAPQCPAPQLLHTPQLLHPARALGVAVA